MVPRDFLLFPQLKLQLHGHYFESINAIKQNSSRLSPKVDLSKVHFRIGRNVKHSCITMGGYHFEGDKINLEE